MVKAFHDRWNNRFDTGMKKASEQGNETGAKRLAELGN